MICWLTNILNIILHRDKYIIGNLSNRAHPEPEYSEKMISNIHSSKVRLDKFDSSIGLDRGAGKLKEGCWYLCKIVFFLSALPYPSKFKCFILRLFGAKVGVGVNIKPRVNIHMPWKLNIGDFVWIGEEVFILNFEMVKIGSHACLSQRSFLCCGNHDFRDPSMPYRNAPITISEGAWVGAGCFIGPGTFIGIDTVVAATSTVIGNLEPDSIYKGNPAKFYNKRWK